MRHRRIGIRRIAPIYDRVLQYLRRRVPTRQIQERGTSHLKTSVDRFLLRPLRKRTSLAADQKAVAKALDRLDDRALGTAVLRNSSKAAKAARDNAGAESWRDPEVVRTQIVLSIALYESRRVSYPLYVYFAVAPVESINEQRWLDGNFNDELNQIVQKIKEIELEGGLRQNQYWPKNGVPERFRARYNLLNDQYGAVLDRHFLQALREFGLDELADLRERDQKEFDRLRERGRRAVHHADELYDALKDIVVRNEEEASRTASVRAYSAAIVMLGACLEGLLLIRCLKSKTKAVRVAKKLPRNKRPQDPADPTKWWFENLINVCVLAGWMPRISTKYGHYDAANLGDILREMRNLTHPGKCAREMPWSETSERDYDDAKAIYVALRSKLLGRKTFTDDGIPHP